MCIGFLRKRLQPVELNPFSYKTESGDLQFVMVTNVGKVRTNNEDAATVSIPQSGKLLIKKGVMLLMADGMGGHNCGEVASAMAIDEMSKKYYNKNAGIKRSLKYAVNKTNKAVYRASQEDEKLSGMGTTCTAMVIVNNEMYLAHVGDSRAYIKKNNSLQRITTDHTLVQQCVREGTLTPEEAERHPQRNVLIQALGTKPFINADIEKLSFVLDYGDILLLCSDGMYDYLNDKEIANVLSSEKTIEKKALFLVKEARFRGGHDNITVLLAERMNAKDLPELKNTMDTYISKFIKTS